MIGLISIALILFLGTVYIVWPFISAILGAIVIAIIFKPLHDVFLEKTGGHKNTSALITFSIIVCAVLLPLSIVGVLLVGEASDLYFSVVTNDTDPEHLFALFHDSLPNFGRTILEYIGIGRFELIKMKLGMTVEESLGAIASQAVFIGGSALTFFASVFLALYVTFFMIRDGDRLSAIFCSMLPMEDKLAQSLCERSVSIVRATIKGSIVVGIVQGIVGGFTFWIAGLESVVLLGVLLALASLIPVVGTALVWVPVAIWLFLSGNLAESILVVFSGLLVIGLVDNLIRPILVGRDTGIPDWVVLISTLGGISTLGFSGIILGPVIIGLFMAGWSMLHEALGFGNPKVILDQ